MTWLLTAVVLTACGGGGGAGSGGFLGTSDTPPYKLSILTTDTDGVTTNQFSAADDLNVDVRLTDLSGKAVAGVSVSLSTSVGQITPPNGSSLTNDDGIASFVVSYNGTIGAGALTATYASSEGDVDASVDIEAVEQATYLLQLQTRNYQDEETKRFYSDQTLTVIATLYQTNNDQLLPVEDALISADATLGTISPDSGTRLTGASGEAIFSLTSPDSAGAGVVTVNYELPTGEVLERSQNFEVIQVTGGAAYTITLELLDPQGNDSRTVSSDAPLTAVVTLESIDGQAPINNQVITLSSDIAATVPASGTALSDQAGQAEFRLEVDSIVGAGTVTASVGEGENLVSTTLTIETVVIGLNQTLRINTRTSSGAFNNTFSEGYPLYVDVSIINDDGTVADIDDQPISLTSEVGQVLPGTGSALTDNGVARFELAFDGNVGAGLIEASYQTPQGVLVATAGVEARGTETYTVSITTSTAPVTPSSPQNVSVTVRRGSSYAGSVVYNELVTLTSEATDIEPTNGGALTTGGSANFTLKFNGTEGAGQVTATYVAPNGDTFINSAAVYAENEQTPYQVDIQQASGSTFSNVNPLPLTVLLTSNGNPVTDAVINLESDVGVITPNNSAALTNSSGIATFSLLGDGSTGAGSVTATFAPQDGDEITDVITVQMLSSDEEVNFDRVSMTFVGADPLSIALRGTGGGTGLEERSEVRFRLTDPAGNPVTDQVVSFRLSTTLGGIELLEPQVVSDSNGEVVATVWAGAIPTPVRVIAETESTPLDNTDDPLRVFSDVLTIAAGVATQQRFTVVADVLNPPDAAAVDGIEVNITAFLFDRFGNPVPDGTAVSFSSECGGVGSSGGPTGACLTTTGSCSVTWFSQNVGDPEPGTPSTQIPGFCSDGRATILGYALGEEDYDDNDSDGFYTVGGTVNGSLSSDAWTPSRQDNSEAFLDADEAGTQSGREFFVDWADNNLWDEFTGDPLNAPLVEADSKYNGAACVKDENNTTDDYNAALDCYNNLVYVFDSVVLVPGPSESGSLTLTTPVGFTGATVGSSYIFTLGFEADGEENIPPLGTTISVSAEGECEIVGTDSWEIPNSNARSPYVFGFTVGPATGTPPSLLTIEWQTPSGVPQQAVYNCSP